MAGIIAILKAIFGVKHKPTPREMAEAQIRVIEQAIMEYNSKDRALHRDKEKAIRDGREADTKRKEIQRRLDDLPPDDSFARDELASTDAELKMEIAKARSNMDLADGNILQNRRLLEGAEKTLIRLRGALEAGVPPSQLLQMVKEISEMGTRYDMAVDDVGQEIGGLFGSAAEEAALKRQEANAASEARTRKAQSSARTEAGSQPSADGAHTPHPVSERKI